MKLVKKIFLAQSLGSRKRGRLRLSRSVELDEEVKSFGIRKWWMVHELVVRENGFLANPTLKDELWSRL